MDIMCDHTSIKLIFYPNSNRLQILHSEYDSAYKKIWYAIAAVDENYVQPTI
jgi:hypothetical protein